MLFRSGVPFGVAVGVTSGEYRVEAALGYQTNKVDKWKEDGIHLIPITDNSRLSDLSYMVNGYRDFTIKNSGVSPYLSAGLGAASFTAKADGSSDERKTVFAWQAGVGVGIKASDNLVVDLGYRYFKPSELKFPNSISSLTFSSSNLLAGVRYTF